MLSKLRISCVKQHLICISWRHFLRKSWSLRKQEQHHFIDLQKGRAREKSFSSSRYNGLTFKPYHTSFYIFTSPKFAVLNFSFFVQYLTNMYFKQFLVYPLVSSKILSVNFIFLWNLLVRHSDSDNQWWQSNCEWEPENISDSFQHLLLYKIPVMLSQFT